MLIASTARDAPESFYFPREFLRMRDWKWEPKFTMALLSLGRNLHKLTNKPVSGNQAPERNQACPCGSNRKYKKCCGAS